MPPASQTICALATPDAPAGLAIVRLSGPKTLQILDRCFPPPPPSLQRPGTVRLRWFGPAANPIDQVMLLVYRAPKSFTGEDMAEIICHGGRAVSRAILSRLLHCGCRSAAPGEFTRRALLAGKLSLSQAEAILELSRAETDAGRQRAVQVYSGAVSNFTRALLVELADLRTELEYRIGFEDENTPVSSSWQQKVQSVVEQLTHAIKTGQDARRRDRDVNVAIIGRPNVGKSSVFNTLLRHERSVVYHLPGTTRDSVDARLQLGRISIRLADTAGLPFRSGGALARASAAQTIKAVESADLLLAVFDASRPFSPADQRVLDLCAGRACLYVLNKTDLPSRFRIESLPGPAVTISCRTGSGFSSLRRRLARRISPTRVDAVTTIERHLHTFGEARGHLLAALRSPGLDSAALEIGLAVAKLEEVDAEPSRTDILDRVFNRFCVGK